MPALSNNGFREEWPLRFDVRLLWEERALTSLGAASKGTDIGSVMDHRRMSPNPLFKDRRIRQ